MESSALVYVAGLERREPLMGGLVHKEHALNDVDAAQVVASGVADFDSPGASAYFLFELRAVSEFAFRDINGDIFEVVVTNADNADEFLH